MIFFYYPTAHADLTLEIRNDVMIGKTIEDKMKSLIGTGGKTGNSNVKL